MTLPVHLPGAVDTHVHVFEPERFPYAADRTYTPGRITAEDLAAFLDGHGLDRVVLVQPSVYGHDNGALVDALQKLGVRARGIAVVDVERVSDRELSTLDASGVRGIRLNLATRGDGGLATAIEAAERRLAGSAWAIQIFAQIGAIRDAAKQIARLERPVILDHFGGIRLGAGDTADSVAPLIELARNGPAYVKVSAAHRVSAGPPSDWSDVGPLARRLARSIPEKLIWGSDWPHTGTPAERALMPPGAVQPFQKIDDRLALRQLADWCGDEATRRTILVETPSKLFGFQLPTT